MKQKLEKKDIDEWIKGGQWKFNTFKSENKLWNLVDSISDALGLQSCSF
jgi:hypothetical protein